MKKAGKPPRLVPCLLALLAAACFTGAAWIGAERWARGWIDQQDENAPPAAEALERALFIWQHRQLPNSQDNDRLPKLAALRLQALLHRTPPPTAPEIAAALRNELEQLLSHLLDNHPHLPKALQQRIIRQATLYLNRATLLNRSFAPLLKDFVASREPAMEQAQAEMSAEERQDWQREMMLYALLSGQESRYWVNRNRYLRTLRESNWPEDFAEGVGNFYDGTLLCALNRMGDEIHGLDAAARQLGAHPALAADFLHRHLNSLILQQAQTGGKACRAAVARLTTLEGATAQQP